MPIIDLISSRERHITEISMILSSENIIEAKAVLYAYNAKSITNLISDD